MADMPSDMLAHNRVVIDDFRANGAPPGRPLLLLTTVGRRSGTMRTSPMMYVADGNRLLVIASNAGARDHPQWYLNLVTEPRVHVEVGDQSYDATAHVTTGDEYDRLWALIVAGYPFFADHQAGVERRIPVVALEREKR